MSTRFAYPAILTFSLLLEVGCSKDIFTSEREKLLEETKDVAAAAVDIYKQDAVVTAELVAAIKDLRSRATAIAAEDIDEARRTGDTCLFRLGVSLGVVGTSVEKLFVCDESNCTDRERSGELLILRMQTEELQRVVKACAGES